MKEKEYFAEHLLISETYNIRITILVNDLADFVELPMFIFEKEDRRLGHEKTKAKQKKNILLDNIYLVF